MIPPLPTINDSLGLLAAVADPVKSKAMLEEMQAHVKTSNEALDKAREETRQLEASRVKTVADAAKLIQDRRAFEGEKARVAAKWASDVASMGALSKEITDRDTALKQREAVLVARENAAVARENEAKSRVAALDQREKALAVREDKADRLLKSFEPLALQLGR